MTNEQQQVEAWRREYFELTGELSGYSAKWAGFVLAKRSQPVIELPKYDTHCYDEVDLTDVWSHSRESIINAITAAGYTYTVAK